MSLELGNGHGAAAVLLGCRYVVLGVAGCPLLLQELRDADMCAMGIVVLEVREEAGAELSVRAAASAVGAEPQPVLAPPVVPLGVGRLVDRLLVEALAGPVLARIPSVLGQAEVEVAHILEGSVAGVVHDDVENYTDAALVGLGNEGTELVNGTHVRIESGPVKAIVAVVSPVSEVA